MTQAAAGAIPGPWGAVTTFDDRRVDEDAGYYLRARDVMQVLCRHYGVRCLFILQPLALLEENPSGSTADGPFDDMRDGDDVLACCFEAITTTGKYFWLPPERVIDMQLHPLKRPRDLFWRRATVQIADGPDGDVYLPTIYPPLDKSAGEPTDALRLGRATDWHQMGESGPTRGIGAVTLVVGEESRTWLEMSSIQFKSAA